jgi:hypothetical protein
MASLNLEVSPSTCSRRNNIAFPGLGIGTSQNTLRYLMQKLTNGRPARLPAIRFLQVHDTRLIQYKRFNGFERSRWLSA